MGNVTFLGVEGSGKTVLTMALVNAFKAHEADGWFLRPETRGAFRFLAQVPENVSGASLPHQTTALRQLQWSVVYGNEVQRTLDILDYPGEVYRLAFLDAKDDPDPAGFRERVTANKEEIDALLGHLMDSDQIFVLFNLEDGQDLANNPANLDAVWVTNACLDYLHRLPSHPSITLLLTQIDKYVNLETHELDPQVFVAHHLPLIAHNFPDLDVLGVSAIGAGESTFGVDGIVLRCLDGTPRVSELLNGMRSAREALEASLECATRAVSFPSFTALRAAFTRYTDAFALSNGCWFIKRALEADVSLGYSAADREALERILSLFGKEALLSAFYGFLSDRQKGMRQLLARLDACSGEGEVAAVWLGRIREAVQRHLEELGAVARSREGQYKAALALGVVCVLVWGIVLIVA